MISPAAEKLARECIRGYQGYVTEIKRMEAEAATMALPRQSTPVVYRNISGVLPADRTISGMADRSARYRGLCRRVRAVEACLGLSRRNDFVKYFVLGMPMPEIMATLHLSRRRCQAIRKAILQHVAESLLGDAAVV
jgi:hypothetical protein